MTFIEKFAKDFTQYDYNVSIFRRQCKPTIETPEKGVKYVQI